MPGVSRAADGELALVLHTHMPYVEGFGTWPSGEEWLFEAIAGSYLPLLGPLERAGGEQLEQRQVAAGDRLPQPLLAERPRAEALDIGHVRVQHDRQRTAVGLTARSGRAPTGEHG